MPVVALYVLGFAGFAVLGFLLRHWVGLVLPPIVWLLIFLGPDLGWWGSGSQETAWILFLPFSVLSMLTMTVWASFLAGVTEIGRAEISGRQTGEPGAERQSEPCPPQERVSSTR